MAKIKDTRQAEEQLRVVTPSGKNEASFFELVYQVARQIPYGRVTTYGAIANALGSKLSARMVGWAMNGAHQAGSDVPAHRVVNRTGMLTGKFHFGTIDRMQQLLENEGIKVENDSVVHFSTLFWDPSEELMK
jgi:methylated-DNA-protein-cysteine methyltransferase related protein